MLKTFLIVSFLSSLSVGALAACPKYKKVYGMLDLNSKNLKEVEVNQSSEELCGTLPTPLNANLKITVTKKKQKFETKIFRSMDGYFDQPTKDKKFTGGTYKLNEIEITSFIPDWYKGSTLTITDLSNNKVLTETKLK